jgi:hypothetical protein
MPERCSLIKKIVTSIPYVTIELYILEIAAVCVTSLHIGSSQRSNKWFNCTDERVDSVSDLYSFNCTSLRSSHLITVILTLVSRTVGFAKLIFYILNSTNRVKSKGIVFYSLW